MRQRNRLNGAHGESRVDTLEGLSQWCQELGSIVKAADAASPLSAPVPSSRPSSTDISWYFRHRRAWMQPKSAVQSRLDRASRKRKREAVAAAADPLPPLSFDSPEDPSDPLSSGGIYVAIVLGGLAGPAMKEIQEKLGVRSDRIFLIKHDDERKRSVGGEASQDKIVFQTSCLPLELQRLRCPQMLLAFLALGSAPPQGSTKEQALEWYANLVTSSDYWNAAVALWRVHRGVTAKGLPCESLTFRGSVVRDGKHCFTSINVAASIGAACQKKHGWTVDLTGFDIDVKAIITQYTVVVGIEIPSAPRRGSAAAAAGSRGPGCSLELDPDSSASQGGERQTKRKGPTSTSKLTGEPRHLLADDYQRVSTLRPSTAYQMLLLANIKPGEFVCDCMCGVGTIPLEAAAMLPGNVIFSLGGEVREESISVAGASVEISNRRAVAAGTSSQYFRRGGRSMLVDTGTCLAGHEKSDRAMFPVEFCRWDAQRLPLRSGSVDVFCVDMPFGVSCKLRKKSFHRILSEIDRTLRDTPESRAVILYQARKSFRKAIREMNGRLHIESVRVVNVGGLLVGLYVVKKGPGPEAQAKSSDMRKDAEYEADIKLKEGVLMPCKRNKVE